MNNNVQRMFSHPFSFEGRIRRLEYGLSTIIYVVFYSVQELCKKMMLTEQGIVWGLLFLALTVILFWFYLAQGTKRCHDLGNSGWYQLIPFYGLWLLFSDGDDFDNGYGSDPKGRDSIEEMSEEQDGD